MTTELCMQRVVRVACRDDDRGASGVASCRMSDAVLELLCPLSRKLCSSVCRLNVMTPNNRGCSTCASMVAGACKRISSQI